MLSLLLTLVVLGVIIYLVTAFIPMAPNFVKLIQVVGIIVALVIVANFFGVGMYSPHLSR